MPALRDAGATNIGDRTLGKPKKMLKSTKDGTELARNCSSQSVVT